MKKLYYLSFLCCLLFSVTVFAQQQKIYTQQQAEEILFSPHSTNEMLPPYIIQEREDFDTPIAIEMEGYEEYLKEYKSSQTTENTVVLPSGENITITTKGAFHSSYALSLCPEYIKIKEHKAGSLKKGDCIYFEINKGKFLKDISADTTYGNIKATALGEGSYIKLEITETSTIPSEITLSRIMILSEQKNTNGAEKNEFTLSLSSKYIDGNNIFESVRSVILNTRFASMEWDNRTICYNEGYRFRFEGRLLFANDLNYCILNDNVMPLYYNTYMKQNYLMVPLRSLYHTFMVADDYCNTHVYHPSLYHYYMLNWDEKQKTATIGDTDDYNACFQNNSNIVTVMRAYREPPNNTNTIELPVSAEIKNNVLYVPVCIETVEIILNQNMQEYMHWNDNAKTMLIER